MGIKILSSRDFIIKLENGDQIPIILERFRAPILFEEIIRSIPIRSRLFLSRDQMFVYIPLGLKKKIGIGGRDLSIKKGDVGFMVINQSLIIGLKDGNIAYPFLLIGKVKNLSSLKVLEGIQSSINVEINIHEA